MSSVERGDAVPRNVLVVAPDVGRATDELCARLVTDLHTAGTVLGVTIVQSPESRRNRWGEHADLTGVETAFVTTGDTTRSAADPHADPLVVETVADPSDLAELGRTIGRRIDATDGDITVCLHSLSALLQSVEREAALQFLHTLADRVTEAGASAHYHLDSAAHDEGTVELFATVVDRVIELDPDGSEVFVA